MPISEKRLADIVAISDEDIDTSEIPEANEAWFKDAKLVIPQGARNAPQPIDDPDTPPRPGPRSLRRRNDDRCAERNAAQQQGKRAGHPLHPSRSRSHEYRTRPSRRTGQDQGSVRATRAMDYSSSASRATKESRRNHAPRKHRKSLIQRIGHRRICDNNRGTHALFHSLHPPRDCFRERLHPSEVRAVALPEREAARLVGELGDRGDAEVRAAELPQLYRVTASHPCRYSPGDAPRGATDHEPFSSRIRRATESVSAGATMVSRSQTICS